MLRASVHKLKGSIVTKKIVFRVEGKRVPRVVLTERGFTVIRKIRRGVDLCICVSVYLCIYVSMYLICLSYVHNVSIFYTQLCIYISISVYLLYTRMYLCFYVFISAYLLHTSMYLCTHICLSSMNIFVSLYLNLSIF